MEQENEPLKNNMMALPFELSFSGSSSFDCKLTAAVC